MKRDLLRSYDSVPVLNFMRIRPARGELSLERKGERAEGGRFTRRAFTEFLGQCEIKTTFNWRQRDVPLQTSNLILCARVNFTFYYLLFDEENAFPR